MFLGRGIRGSPDFSANNARTGARPSSPDGAQTCRSRQDEETMRSTLKSGFSVADPVIPRMSRISFLPISQT